MSKQDLGCGYSTKNQENNWNQHDWKSSKFLEGNLLERGNIKNKAKEELMMWTYKKQSFCSRSVAVGNELWHLQQDFPLQYPDLVMGDHR